MRNNLIIAAALLMLSACHQSSIQGRYSDASEECRDFAEEEQARIGSGNSNIAVRNAELVSLFSDCMSRNGWQVATPKREGEEITRRGTSLLGTTAGAGSTAVVGTSNPRNTQAPVAPQAAPQQQFAPQRPIAPQPQQQPQYFQPAPQQQPQQYYQPQQALQPAPQQQYYQPRTVPQQPARGPIIRQIPEENIF